MDKDERSELKNRFKALWQHDKYAPALVAARTALRVLPLLATEGNFSYWGANLAENKLAEKNSGTAQDDKDNRVQHLLSVFFASNVVVSDLSHDNKLSIMTENIARDAASAARDAATATADADAAAASFVASASADADAAAAAAFDAAAAAAFVASASAYAASAAAFGASAFGAAAAFGASASFASASADASADAIASDASDAAFASADAIASDAAIAIAIASDAAASASADVASELEADCIFLEQGYPPQQLAVLPLWQQKFPKNLEDLYQNKFIPAVSHLIEETELSTSKKALKKLLSDYAGLLNIEQVKPSVTVANDTRRGIEDHLNRTSLVEGLAKFLRDNSNNDHLTIGLLGHWGVGKTRVIDLLRAELQKPQQTDKANKAENPFRGRFLYGEFNAWAYEHSKSIQAGLAHEVMKSLTSMQRGLPVNHKGRWWSDWRNIGFEILNVPCHLLWLLVRTRLVFGFIARKHGSKVLSVLLLIIGARFYQEELGQLVNDWIKMVEENPSTKKESAFFLGVFSIPLGLLFIPVFKQLRLILTQPFTKELLTYVKLPDYAKHLGQVSEMQQDIRLMSEIRLRFAAKDCWAWSIFPKRRLLFVIDDLDRCQPEGIVKTFEAVRLVLDIPQVTVLIAVDQRIALAAMALHYEKLERHHELSDAKAIARDYLGKMIQLPVVLSSPDSSSVKNFLSHIWDDKKPQLWQSLLSEYNWEQHEAEQKIKQQTLGQADEQNLDTVDSKLDSDNKQTQQELELTEQELAKLLINLPAPTEHERITKQVIGLSNEQKAAFAHWTKEFSLRNPRQLKRLYNSYNLLRLVGRYEDQPISTEKDHKLNYPLMVTLITLECVNGIEDTRVRKCYRAYVFDKQNYNQLKTNLKFGEQFERDIQRLKHAISLIKSGGVKIFKVKDQALGLKKMLESVECFVLPAIETNDDEEKQATKGQMKPSIRQYISAAQNKSNCS